jgi:glycosyltransferase involved in cell wall biosynthesis
MDTNKRLTELAIELGSPDTARAHAPLLSIGLPVYNGARHLREAIDSLLAQDFRAFELVISDNASTDETETICKEYAARDGRVRYLRNEANVGAAANYNRVFEASVGKYFMWGSDDDVWDPRFARLCINRLEDSPGAIMCMGQIAFMREGGEDWADFEYETFDTEGLSVEVRVHEVTKQLAAYAVYSVIRSSALRSTRLMLPTFGPDSRLLLELTLLGDALTVPEILFRYRAADSPKSASAHLAEIAPDRLGIETSLEGREPFCYLAREFLDVIRDSDLGDTTIARMQQDFVETLCVENLRWRDLILAERGLTSDAPLALPAIEREIRTALGLPTESAHPGASGGTLRPWTFLEGVKSPRLRRGLLRILQPFGDRQNDLNVRHDEHLALLAHEVKWLQRRVADLEHRRGAGED